MTAAAMLVALSCHGQESAAASKARHREVDALFAPWTGAATPGCALGISRNGALDYARGYGMSNLEHGVPITPRSIFHIASISKQFTAFAIGLLARDGKLSLDDDIRKYLPEMPDYGKTITIAHLIHHTDGLREQGQLLNLAGWRGDDLYTQEDVLWALSRQRHLNFDPGTEIVYGNAAYTLLAVIVQRVSGKPLREFADERIFKPLGMRDTHFHNDHTEMVKGRAAAYSPRAGGGWSVSIPHIDHYGSTSLFSTVGDLLAWQRNLADFRVGGKALATWMQTSGTLSDGTAIGYGGGLRVGAYRGLPMISHDGADAGYRTDAVFFPDQRLAIVALCNGASIAPAELTRKVADIYLRARMTAPALTPALPAAGGAPAAWAGVYWSAQTDEIVRLEWKEGGLRPAGAAMPLVPIGADLYRPGDLSHEWRFVAPAAADAPNAPLELRIRDFWPTTRTFTRIAEAPPGPTELRAFAGRYHSDETDMRYAVRLSEGRLRLSWPRQYDVALEPLGGRRFLSSLGTVTFTQKADGAIDGLTISNRRLRKFRLARLDSAE
jgi:CubicO group peptidase (beta-lactamase class C family)